ncbi:MAG TPA: ABC transporter permease subunit [Candidatus Negativibacillus faecipullorum]|jgi:glutathione transport system permease protein|nr:ABC transporter permease subunit [Candidatus Negativibacillus faecipullorum]
MADIREKEQQQNTDFEKNYIDENIKADQDSKAKAFIKKFMKRKTAVLGLIVIVVLVIIAIIGPYITPYDYTAYDYMNTLAGPSPEHLFGTDQYGRDILSRMLVGTRLTLGVSLSAVVIGAALGTVLGLLAGYYGGVIEMLVMRGSDVLFSFPDILLAIAIVAILGPGIINVLIAVMVFTIPSFARIMRSATLAVKGSLYVEVAQSLGCKDSRLLFVHIFPGTIQSLIVNFTMRIGSAIMAAASLSFLGFGANVSEPEWGAMLSQGRNYIGIASHMVYFPGLIIFITVLAFNLFGDGLRDTLDPKIK